MNCQPTEEMIKVPQVGFDDPKMLVTRRYMHFKFDVLAFKKQAT